MEQASTGFSVKPEVFCGVSEPFFFLEAPPVAVSMNTTRRFLLPFAGMIMRLNVGLVRCRFDVGPSLGGSLFEVLEGWNWNLVQIWWL